MNRITQNAAMNASAKSGEATTAKQPRKRRMSRERKADAAVALEASDRTSTANSKNLSEPRGPSKIAAVIALLQRSEGATLPEMVEVTGWLPHTTRSALTGLKKKGHPITKGKRGDVTSYSLASAAA